MAYSEILANRVREALSELPDVEEKKMFRGITFMVNGKMCVSVGGDEMMCRVDPAISDAAFERNGCRGMMRNGKTMKGFVFVNEELLKDKKEFDYWISESLRFNTHAKSSKKPKK